MPAPSEPGLHRLPLPREGVPAGVGGGDTTQSSHVLHGKQVLRDAASPERLALRALAGRQVPLPSPRLAPQRQLRSPAAPGLPTCSPSSAGPPPPTPRSAHVRWAGPRAAAVWAVAVLVSAQARCAVLSVINGAEPLDLDCPGGQERRGKPSAPGPSPGLRGGRRGGGLQAQWSGMWTAGSSCASFLREMHLKLTRCAEQFVSKALTKLVSL